MKEDINYEKDIEIDHNALDVEWLNQPRLAMIYGKHWAECAKKVQQCEEDVKLVRSRLIREANEDPDEYLGEGVKPTAPNVEAYYREHEDHIEAKNNLIEAQYNLNIAEIAKKEISITRKASLQNLVDLFGMNYFSGPVDPRNLDNEVNKKIKLTQPEKNNFDKPRFKRKKYEQED